MKPNVLFVFLLFACQPLMMIFAQNPPLVEETETHAQFPGGMDAFIKYLADTVNYPLIARENAMEGNVIVRFCVSKDGKVTNIRILKGFGFGCEEEVERVLEAMPAWIPATKDKQPIESFVIIPVQFRLTDI